MKRLKLTFAALAVLVAVGGAFSTNANSNKAAVKVATTLYWYDNLSGTGTPVSGTIGDRMTATGCPDDDGFCEAGYDITQFVDNNPANGLKPDQEPSQILRDQL